jgi:hypothetical protein
MVHLVPAWLSSSLAVLQMGRQILSKFALGALLMDFTHMLENANFLDRLIAK